MCKLAEIAEGKLVADIKMDCIKNVIQQAPDCKQIERIMLFGSSLEERCNESSDIDLAVFGSETRSKFLRSHDFKRFIDQVFLYDMDQDYDILYFREGSQEKAGILRQVNQGLEIYRRDMV